VYTIDDENNRNSFFNKDQSNRLSTVAAAKSQGVKSKLYKDDDDLDGIADIELAYKNTEKENVSYSNNFSEVKSVSGISTGNNGLKQKMDNASNARKKQNEGNVEADELDEYDLDEFSAEKLAESVLAKS